MVRLLLAIRAGGREWVRDNRSDNCSSLATGHAIGSGYQRTGAKPYRGRERSRPRPALGGMPPRAEPSLPHPVGNQAGDYHELMIQGRDAPRRFGVSRRWWGLTRTTA